MRLAFFLLVLVNLVLFVWFQGYLGGRDEGREPHRLEEQIQPEKMKVKVVPPQACRRIDGLAAKDADRLQQELQSIGLAVATHTENAAPSYWVNIPSLPNQAAADKKAGELKALGVAEFHVMQAEGGGFVISLGIYRDAAAADDALRGLVKKGVKSARVETQARPPVASLTVRGAGDLIAKRLADVLAGLSGAASAECP